jgi:hypothetical protein
MKKRNFWLNLFLILVGIVLGGLVAHLTKDISFLSWLSFGESFGTTAPVTVDLGVMSVTLGVSLNISVAVVLAVALSLMVGKFIVRK